MGRAVYSILDILAGEKRPFPVAFAEVFQSEGAAGEDDFTYTARFEVSDPMLRNRIAAKLREENPAEAERMLALLETNGWSVSVLVDNY